MSSRNWPLTSVATDAQLGREKRLPAERPPRAADSSGAPSLVTVVIERPGLSA